MSGRDEPRWDRRRGRHKKRASRETRDWNAAHVPPPPGPSIDADTYRALCQLRAKLDLLT